MLYPIYTAVKDRLNILAQHTEWYNVQYEGTILRQTGLFIEFPDELKFDPESKSMRRTPVKIRVHYYSKAMQTQDGISDSVVLDHETIAREVMDLLDGFTPTNGSCKRMMFMGWKHWHRWKGWMVTFIDFTAKKEL